MDEPPQPGRYQRHRNARQHQPGGEWNDNKTSGLYESNGKGELNGVTSINGVIFAKDIMNNDRDGLLIGTLAPDTYYAEAWSVMIGTNIDNQAIEL
mgnify:CR=1 FL=1